MRPRDNGNRRLDVAVIIPCYNGAPFLARALDSALVQTHPARTIHIVDDASTDETPAIAARYAATHSTIRYHRLDENVGPASARNVAIRAATETCIAFLDADDYWLPEHLAGLSEQLARHPSAVVAFSRVMARGGDSPEPPSIGPGRPVNLLRDLLIDNLIPHSAALARRSAVVEAGAYRDGQRYAEDYDLWLRLALEHDFVYSGRATAVRHVHEGQATRSVRQMASGAWDARERLWNRARRKGHAFSESVYRACCQAAYELELSIAWRARNGAVLREVVDLAERVPGGDEQLRKWRWRVRWVWPVWRLAAAVWDYLPDVLRAPLRARRVDRARQHADALRSLGTFAGARAVHAQRTPAGRA